MGIDQIKIQDALGALSPLGSTADDAFRAIDTVFGIPGGLLPAGGPTAALFPQYDNLGTPPDSTLHEILGLIAPGGAGGVVSTDEWLFELTAPQEPDLKILLSSFAGENGTTGDPPLATWATDNNIRLFAAGELVSRAGPTAILSGFFSGAPDGISFNRGLGIGDQIIVQKTVFA